MNSSSEKGAFLIYLDWNITSCFKRLDILPDRKLSDDLAQILSFITNNPQNFIFPYSNAHLRDLLSTDASNEGYVKTDLELLSTISKNFCITQYWGEEAPKLHIREVENHYWDIESDRDLETKSFEEYFDSVSPLLGGMLRTFKSVPVPFNISPEINPVILDCFFNVAKEQTMYGLMKDIFEMHKTIFSDYTIYKEIRNEVYRHFSLNRNGKTPEEILAILETNLSRPELRGIKELSDSTYSKNIHYDKFITTYINVATYTPKKEKLSKSNTLRQIFNDAMHSFYGAYCHAFITNDKLAFEKSKVLYAKYNVSTMLFNPRTFCDYLKEFEIKTYTI